MCQISVLAEGKVGRKASIVDTVVARVVANLDNVGALNAMDNPGAEALAALEAMTSHAVVAADGLVVIVAVTPEARVTTVLDHFLPSQSPFLGKLDQFCGWSGPKHMCVWF